MNEYLTQSDLRAAERRVIGELPRPPILTGWPHEIEALRKWHNTLDAEFQREGGMNQ